MIKIKKISTTKNGFTETILRSIAWHNTAEYSDYGVTLFRHTVPDGAADGEFVYCSANFLTVIYFLYDLNTFVFFSTSYQTAKKIRSYNQNFFLVY